MRNFLVFAVFLLVAGISTNANAQIPNRSQFGCHWWTGVNDEFVCVGCGTYEEGHPSWCPLSPCPRCFDLRVVGYDPVLEAWVYWLTVKPDTPEEEKWLVINPLFNVVGGETHVSFTRI